ncbi:MAG: hypothetical protein ACYTGC_07285 [Planctomycetota bacterium]
MLSAVALASALLMPASLASAAKMYYDADASYYSFQDSPFLNFSNRSDVAWYLEDFEDGLMNTIGASMDAGFVLTNPNKTDSIDMDDGLLDGWGNEGASFKHRAIDGDTLTITFDENEMGQLPTRVGLAWTDGNPNALVRFEAFDADGDSIGAVETSLGDSSGAGETAEDRFFGVRFNGGVHRITVYHEFGGLEIDHLQYGFVGAVIPLPPAVAMGLAGLGLVAVRRRLTR